MSTDPLEDRIYLLGVDHLHKTPGPVLADHSGAPLLKALDDASQPILGERRQRKSSYHIYTWLACPVCSKEHWVRVARKDRSGPPGLCWLCSVKQFPGTQKRGSDSPYWKGGRYINSRGYVEVRIQPDNFFYPMAKERKGLSSYILEHRLIMAQVMKRHLLSWEIVHHRNGIKQDNRLENLVLLAGNGKHNALLNKRIKELEAQVRKLQTSLSKCLNKGEVK